jgi:sn-glycerol 3-phosphate transport system ATP-binding protein
MGAISVRDVVKHYGHGSKANPVIHGFSAEIADGEFVVIVGPSGCGKSTLLRMVAGLEEITAGEISITGRVVNDIEPSERDIAMVFQNYALYPHMTVFDNMAYALKIAKVPVSEIRARVDKAAAILELGPFLARRPRELSGGQRQRVAMGRAIVRQPQVFLFDEPLSNLDAKLRAQTRLEIQKLHAELGVTSLFVTHDQVEAMTLAQRMIVMNAGRMEQFGTPEEVYARPATTFVAGFIGSPPMNLLTGQAAADATFLTDQGVRLPLPKVAPGGVQGTGERILGVRPEHLAVAQGEPGTGEVRWTLKVEVVEMLGAERLVHGRLGDAAPRPGSLVRATDPASLFTVRLDAGEHSSRAGDVLPLRVRADRLHWFDAVTQHRLAD